MLHFPVNKSHLASYNRFIYCYNFMLVNSRLIYVYLASVVFFLHPWRFNQHVSKWIFYSVTTLTIHQLKIFSLFLSHCDFLWFLTVSNNYFSLSRTTVRSVDQPCNLQRKTRCGERKKKKNPQSCPGWMITLITFLIVWCRSAVEAFAACVLVTCSKVPTCTCELPSARSVFTSSRHVVIVCCLYAL